MVDNAVQQMYETFSFWKTINSFEIHSKWYGILMKGISDKVLNDRKKKLKMR